MNDVFYIIQYLRLLFFRSDILLAEFDFLHHSDALPRGFRGGFEGVGRGEPSLNPH